MATVTITQYRLLGGTCTGGYTYNDGNNKVLDAWADNQSTRSVWFRLELGADSYEETVAPGETPTRNVRGLNLTVTPTADPLAPDTPWTMTSVTT